MNLDEELIWSEFANDASEALAAIEGALLVLEAAPTRRDEIDRLYRGLHTIKGNAGFLGLAWIERLAHGAEDLIGLIRDHGVALDAAVVDLVLRVVDQLRHGVDRAGRERRDLDGDLVAGLVADVGAAYAARATGPAAAPVAAAPVAEPMAASAPVDEPLEPLEPLELIEPSLDAGYVEVFLALVGEVAPAIGLAVVAAGDPDGGAAACAEVVARCADLELAAERMGYVHVSDRLMQLARAAGAGAVADLPDHELALYAALVPIEASYRGLVETPIETGLGALYQRACAAVVLVDLACLHVAIDAERPSPAELRERFARLRAACAHLELAGAADGLLEHEDRLGRAHEAGVALDARARADVQAFLAELGHAIQLATSSDLPVEVPRVEVAPPPTIALPVSAAIRAQLSAPIAGHLAEALAGGAAIVELHAELERHPDVGARFHAWLARPGTRLITSATVGAGDVVSYRFLVAVARPPQAVADELAAVDPAGAALALDALDGRGPHPVAAPPSPPAAPGAPPPAERPPPRAVPDDDDARDPIRSDYLRIDARKVSLIMDLAGELGLASGAVTHHPELDGLELEGFVAATHKLEALIRELQNEVSAMRLVPVAGVFQRMRRVVRDTARRTGKQVDLVLQGEDTEIDKVMVDALSDPLVHIIRNAIDHGLEPPAARAAAGKPAVGRIVLEAAHQGGEVSVTISDDGAGLDRDRIWARAVERGLVDGAVRPDDDAIDALIFLPGFSTKAAIDELSGRGVGMDVVRSTIEGLRGRVAVRSTPGRGSRVTLTMPLTLAFVEAMIVGERDRLYAVPIEKVFEVFQVRREQIATNSADGQRLLRVRDQVVPVCWLHRFYAEPGEVDEELAGRIAVVVQSAHGSLAIPIDRLLGNQQIMLKPLTGALAGVRAAAGCGMLRSGDVALTLDCELLHA